MWEAAEQVNFERVLDVFERRTGAHVEYISTEGEDIAAVLDAKLARGEAPDVAVLPQPGLLREYECAGALVPLGKSARDAARKHYAAAWQELALVDGELYGVWVKAANKSLVWYSVGEFESAGIVPPDDLDGLLALAHELSATGTPAFAVGGRDAWTLTDWFENVYLQVAGPERYDEVARRKRPWTDPTVREALSILAELFAPELLAGGAEGARSLTFEDSVDAVFRRSPRAAMVFEGDFVRGVASGDADVGVDVDAFPFPSDHKSASRLVVGGDVAVLMRNSPGGRALMDFLATSDAGEVWARLGGFVSPNEDVPLDAYPDQVARSIARALLEAGDELRFDLSDLQPAAFGATTGAGMLAILQDFLTDPSALTETTERLEAAAMSAYESRGTSPCRSNQPRASSAAL